MATSLEGVTSPGSESATTLDEEALSPFSTISIYLNLGSLQMGMSLDPFLSGGCHTLMSLITIIEFLLFTF